MPKRLENLTKRLINEGKKTIYIGLSAAALYGCSRSVSEIPFEERKSNFFTCDYYIDKNQDGIWEESEYEGKDKINFKNGETVTLVAHICNRVGANVRAEIYNWSDSMISSAEQIVTGRNEFKTIKIPPTDYRKIGLGEYTANWYINNTLVYVNRFKIIQ